MSKDDIPKGDTDIIEAKSFFDGLSGITLTKNDYEKLITTNIELTAKLDNLAQSIAKLVENYNVFWKTQIEFQTSLKENQREFNIFLEKELPDILDDRQRRRWVPWVSLVAYWGLAVVCFGSLIFVAVYKSNATEFETIIYNIVSACGGAGATKAMQITKKTIADTNTPLIKKD